MISDFKRTITLLRKERGLSQKKVASDLGISQALLSHYEKGIRECGLEFLVKISDYYDVSCDYLLGRSADRSGSQIVAEDIPDPDSGGKDNVFRGSVAVTLNKKLIANSINIIYDLLQKINNKGLTQEVSGYFMLAIYRIFFIIYSSNNQNPKDFFAVSRIRAQGVTQSAISQAVANIMSLLNGESFDQFEPVKEELFPSLSTNILTENYPLFASSLLNLIKTAEERMGVRKAR